MPARRRRCELALSSRSPRSDTVPVAFVNPVTASTNVVLPAPLGPISPTISPAETVMSMSVLALTPPYRTDSPPVSRSVVGAVCGSAVDSDMCTLLFVLGRARCFRMG